ncbi:MAG: hypothetical protein M3R55_03650 [Acidobacteriota bacterium]|nr:hypothetical protein [Acidobacteriota bacterium]
MVINDTQHLTMGHTARRSGAQEGLISRLAAWFTQFFCGMFHGHHAVLQFEGERMLLRCTSCGHDSPGWDINAERPRVTLAGDPRRHSLGTQQAIVPIRKAS